MNQQLFRLNEFEEPFQRMRDLLQIVTIVVVRERKWIVEGDLLGADVDIPMLVEEFSEAQAGVRMAQWKRVLVDVREGIARQAFVGESRVDLTNTDARCITTTMTRHAEH